ncbi:MAG TPA: FG-GAP-like repeat-containing protein [Pyrinomonadaceae bacterium]|jgi:uncharacterized delta-60 repeat protein
MKQFSVRRFTAQLLGAALTFFGILTVFAASGDVDPSFNASAYGLQNGIVNVIQKQPDGKYLVGGTFWDVNGVAAGGLARLNADLTVDASFNPADFGNGFGFGGAVFAIGVQSDGKIIVAGDISGANNVFKPGVKRLNADGSLDNSFLAPEVSPGTVYKDLVVLPDDKIIVGNQRLNADGSLDNSFTTLTVGSEDVEILPDGKILSAGGSIARFNSNGTADNSFVVANAGGGLILAIAPLPDGKILIGGGFTSINGFQVGRIARLNADGTLDLSFNQNMVGSSGQVSDIILKSDGKIIIAGGFGTYNNVTRSRVAQLNADGSLDTSFLNSGATTAGAANDAELLSDGKILAGFSGNLTAPAVLRFNADGTLDNSLNLVVGNGTSRVRRITQQADGKILFVGRFNYVNGVQRRSAARLNLDGTLDTSFVPYFTSAFDLTAVAAQADGKVVIGGFQGPVVARLNTDGSRDTGFTAAATSGSSVYDVAVLPNGQILAVGDIGLTSPSATKRIVRFNTDGTIDSTFALNQPNATVFKLHVQPDGKILIGGAFSQIGASLRGRIARLNADGSLDETFNPAGGANGDVYNIDVQTDGKVVLGGNFNGLNGALNRNRVGRLNADGSLDTSFVQPLFINSAVVGLEVQSDNKIIVTGNFNVVGAAPKLGLARFNADGSLDLTFNPSINNALPSTSGALDVYLQTDGKILVGGEFTKMNGVSHVRIARLLNSTAPPRTLFDFDGDGKADIAVFRTNRWFILRSSDLQIDQPFFGLPDDIAAPADFDGDGKTDLGIFRPSTGDWWYQSSINNAQIQVHWGQSGDVPRPSDFDGDGKSDFVVYRPSNNAWYRLGSTGATSILAFGTAGDNPLIGDFDGDGKSDVAIYRPSTGDWWYASSINGQFISVHWGASGDIPAPGDYDGDGKTDFAVFRPSQGGWYILNSSNGSATTLSFGLNGDKPVPADYDGDGRWDIAVFRPSNNTCTWYLLQSTNGFGAVQFGLSVDVPVENAFLP